MVALALAMALSGICFLSLILALLLVHWMLGMALSDFVSCPNDTLRNYVILFPHQCLGQWSVMVAPVFAMARSGLPLMSLILFPVSAHWMLAMALSGLFS